MGSMSIFGTTNHLLRLWYVNLNIDDCITASIPKDQFVKSKNALKPGLVLFFSFWLPMYLNHHDCTGKQLTHNANHLITRYC